MGLKVFADFLGGIIVSAQTMNGSMCNKAVQFDRFRQLVS